MSVFEYKGLDKSGRSVKGTLESESLKTAKVELKKKGVFLQDIKIKTREGGKQPPISDQKK